MFNRVLVPTDFRAPSDAALECARTLAGRFGASLHLLHVGENVFLRAVVADPHALQAAAMDHLNDRLTEDDRQGCARWPSWSARIDRRTRSSATQGPTTSV